MLIFASYYYFGRGLNLNSTSGILLLAALGFMVLGLIAQARVKKVFNQYSSVRSSSGLTASQVAERLLRNNGSQVAVKAISGSLTDNYNPKAGCVSLSEAVYNSESISAIAVAAHECGHVMQYENGYSAIKLRNFLLPAANFGSRFSYIIVILGLFMGSFGYYVSLVGVALFAFALAFQLLTLPIELNASRRALDMLTAEGFISGGEEEGAARKVLNAAAATYVVAALASAVTFLRLLSIAGSRRR